MNTKIFWTLQRVYKITGHWTEINYEFLKANNRT